MAAAAGMLFKGFLVIAICIQASLARWKKPGDRRGRLTAAGEQLPTTTNKKWDRLVTSFRRQLNPPIAKDDGPTYEICSRIAPLPWYCRSKALPPLPIGDLKGYTRAIESRISRSRQLRKRSREPYRRISPRWFFNVVNRIPWWLYGMKPNTKSRGNWQFRPRWDNTKPRNPSSSRDEHILQPISDYTEPRQPSTRNWQYRPRGDYIKPMNPSSSRDERILKPILDYTKPRQPSTRNWQFRSRRDYTKPMNPSTSRDERILQPISDYTKPRQPLTRNWQFRPRGDYTKPKQPSRGNWQFQTRGDYTKPRKSSSSRDVRRLRAINQTEIRPGEGWNQQRPMKPRISFHRFSGKGTIHKKFKKSVREKTLQQLSGEQQLRYRDGWQPLRPYDDDHDSLILKRPFSKSSIAAIRQPRDSIRGDADEQDEAFNPTLKNWISPKSTSSTLQFKAIPAIILQHAEPVTMYIKVNNDEGNGDGYRDGRY